MSAHKQGVGPAPAVFTCQPEVAHIWEFYNELDAARGSTGFGPLPISYAEIEAWASLTGRKPEPWEVGGIKALDRVWLNVFHEKPEDGENV